VKSCKKHCFKKTHCFPKKTPLFSNMCTFLSHWFETNNYHCLSQMSSMMRWCAVRMFHQGWFKVNHCMTVFRVHYISFDPLVRSTNNCTNIKYEGSMCSAYVWPRLVQDQGHSSRLNIVRLYWMVGDMTCLKWLHKCKVEIYHETMCRVQFFPR